MDKLWEGKTDKFGKSSKAVSGGIGKQAFHEL
jgi:hypothetical protein